MTEDDLRTFLEANKDDIQRAVKAKAIEAMAESVRYRLPDTVSAVVAEFVAAEVVPAIKLHLQENKGPIIEAAVKAASEIGDKVSELLVKQAVESMTGYRAGDVVKALMGVR